MEYPKHEQYARMYARYLVPGRTDQMLELCGDLSGKRVLDLCGGGGRASRAALARGAAEVTLLDESMAMCQDIYPGEGRLRVVVEPLEHRLDISFYKPFDVAICQQAINYWFNKELVARLRKNHLKQGSVFVFNTFNEAPPTFPSPKAYVCEGRNYLELSWLTPSGMVEHVQVCEGEPVHTTKFQWISPEEYREVLSPFFTVEELREGKTSIYRCVAK